MLLIYNAADIRLSNLRICGKGSKAAAGWANSAELYALYIAQEFVCGNWGIGYLFYIYIYIYGGQGRPECVYKCVNAKRGDCTFVDHC